MECAIDWTKFASLGNIIAYNQRRKQQNLEQQELQNSETLFPHAWIFPSKQPLHCRKNQFSLFDICRLSACEIRKFNVTLTHFSIKGIGVKSWRVKHDLWKILLGSARHMENYWQTWKETSKKLGSLGKTWKTFGGLRMTHRKVFVTLPWSCMTVMTVVSIPMHLVRSTIVHCTGSKNFQNVC